MRVLIFGDSITQGFWDADGGWVNALRKYYDQKQAQDLKGRDDPVIFNLGISADTSKNIVDRIKTETIARTRHGQKPILIVQIGINDSMIEAGQQCVTPDDYTENLKAILTIANDVASKLILVGLSACDEKHTTPVSWGDYHYTNERIKQYEHLMEHIAEQNKVPFIPIFDKFKMSLDEGQDLLADGLHPNKDGHELIYSLVKPELENLLI